MLRHGIIIMLLAVLLSGCITPQSSDVSEHAVTQEDREWAFNASQEVDRIDSLIRDVAEAHRHRDYEAAGNFADAMIDTSDRALQSSFQANVTSGMIPAKQAYESSMKLINNAGWELRVYAKNHDETFYERYESSGFASRDCLKVYLRYR